LASAYVLDAARSLTIVLINEDASPVTAQLNLPAAPAGIGSYQTFTSSDGSYWVSSTLAVAVGTASVTVPGYGVVTLYGVGSSGGSTTSSTGGTTGGSTNASTGGSTGGGSTGTGSRGSSTGVTGAKRSGCSSSGEGPEAALALGIAALVLGGRRRRGTA
jgi:uncharacterized protein (TIGR03382 family)